MSFTRSLFLICILFFILFTPAGNAPKHASTPDSAADLRQYITWQKTQTDALKNSVWDGALNLTGITTPSAGIKNFLPKEIQDSVRQLWVPSNGKAPDTLELVFYSNMSGVYEGSWNRSVYSSDLVPHNMSVEEYLLGQDNLTGTDSGKSELLGTQHLQAQILNVTYPTGLLAVTVNEIPSSTSPNSNVSLLEVAVLFSDHDQGNQFVVNLQGLHVWPTGQIVMATESLKFSGPQLLPHLLGHEQYFEEAKALMSRYFNVSLSYLEKDMSLDLLYEDMKAKSEQCEYIGYGYFASVPLLEHQVSDIELELEHPLGRPLAPIPGMALSTIFYSPDCSFSLESTHASAEKSLLRQIRLRVVLFIGMVLLFLQMALFSRQMKDTVTPSLLSKISIYTLAMLVLADGSVWLATFMSLLLDSSTMSKLAVSFLSFALTVIFEMRYMTNVYRAQIPEQLADARAHAAMQNSSNNGRQSGLIAFPDGTLFNQSHPTQNTPNLLPLPATANTSNVQSEPEQTGRDPAMFVYMRLYIVLVVFIFFSLFVTTLPLRLRIVYEYIVALAAFSMWVPQIYRNTTRGYRKSFLWSFVFGTSSIRLLALFYVCFDTKNILDHRYSPRMAVTTFVWVIIQISVLLAQMEFGSRFFVPKGVLPALYDYHPIIYQRDAETELGIDLSSLGQKLESAPTSNSESKSHYSQQSLHFSRALAVATSIFTKGSHGQKKFKQDAPYTRTSLGEDQVLRPSVDCAICMNPVELVIVPRGSAGADLSLSASLMLARRKYMVTPCQHIFHTDCMQRWMRSRLQCPNCRNPLPPS